MADHYFISYSRIDGAAFALELGDRLKAGPPAYRVWLDQWELQPGPRDWDRQLVEAIQTCTALLFLMTDDSVRDESGCKPEWVAALRYKKPVIPVRLHATAELPFRLSSRQFIDFSDSFDAGAARLREHLSWTGTPAGMLQDLRTRHADAEYELPRTEPALRRRVEEELEELRRRIDEQQRVVESPQEVAEQTQARIGAGMERERQPDRPVVAAPRAKFVNPPPMTAPVYFQDRHVETELIGTFLREDGWRMMSVVGRGGVGKTAMVCRLLKALERGRLPDELGELDVDGIVYLSPLGAHPVDFPHVFGDLCRLLPKEVAEPLLQRSLDPHETPAALMRALLERFPSGRSVLLLDNFENVVDADGGGLTDSALDEALRAMLSSPEHGIKVIITTRIAARTLLLVQPGVQRRLNLDEGLGSPYAEDVLRAMDPDGSLGIKEAPDALLAQARERTRGFPRALEALAAILAADRNTTLPELLATTEQMPDNVVEALVGEAFNRLDVLAQQVMQALAIYTGPVAAVAVDYLLQPFEPTIDSAPVLSRLVNMQFVRRDAGHYYLHQVDRDYALRRIAVGEPSDRLADPPPFSHYALRQRAADYFQQTRTPRDTWRTLDDVAPQLAEFELRYQAGDYDTAAAVLLDIDGGYLQVWGHYRLTLDLHERLQGRLVDPWTISKSKTSLGGCYGSLGHTERAIELYEEALAIDRELGDRTGEAVNLSSLGDRYIALGDAREGIDFAEQALAISRETGARRQEGVSLTLLGAGYIALGETRRAIECYEHSLAIDRELGDRGDQSVDLGNLGAAYARLGETQRAIEFYEEALAINRELGARGSEAVNLGNLGSGYASLGDPRRAIELYEQALAINRDIGARGSEAINVSGLGTANAALGETRRAIDFYEQALAINRDIGARGSEAVNLNTLGSAYVALGETQKAIEFYEQALAINRELGARGNEAVDLSSLGDGYAALGETQRAIEFAEQALAINREIGARRQEGVSLTSLGDSSMALGEPRKAIEFYEQALAIDREMAALGDEAVDLGSIGGAYADLGETQRAIELLEQALAINREIGARGNEAATLIVLASAHTDAGAWEDAARCCEQSLLIADDIGLVRGSSEGRLHLALVHLHAGRPDEAVAAARAAYAYDDPLNEATAALVLGAALLSQGQADGAVEAFREALRVADATIEETAPDHGALDAKALALCGMAVAEHDPGRLPEASTAFRAARAITCADGIVGRVWRFFDALAAADANGTLTPAVRAAAGECP